MILRFPGWLTLFRVKRIVLARWLKKKRNLSLTRVVVSFLRVMKMDGKLTFPSKTLLHFLAGN